ncbi:hypothetical protein DL766_000917 [Monosporascus sp. MC13-8B]|uniref:F-box domain-containing protein n=1 Tax=Monosporascus cannonballus TaxID=155416 RepID=A0ABY0HBG2_9PEZI|nr:hypothetical protein DL762_003303 [Monosporascus cannonballus]RYP00753.1 hypothetical protein DL763_000633 [Monosporascus cannonballus]RYP38500.1 hypothetical protein DL766_000917 [Monosporascus sp. MC13-8B]
MYKNPLASDSGIDISYDDALSSPSPQKGTTKEPKGVLLISQEREQGAPAPAPARRGAPPPSTLLTLPLELRLEIYGYLLTLHTTRQRRQQQTHAKDARLHPAILRTCRQLHAEALAFLLETNEFEAHPTLLASFPRLFPFPAGSSVRDAAQAARVRRLRVRVRLDVELPDDGDGDERVRRLGGLRELVLDVWQADWRAAGPRNLRRFEAVRGVGRARVVGSIGGFEGYARWLENTMMCAPGEDVGPFIGDGCDALTLHS